MNDKGEAEDVVNKIIKIESKNLLINKEDVFFSRRGFLKKTFNVLLMLMLSWFPSSDRKSIKIEFNAGLKFVQV